MSDNEEFLRRDSGIIHLLRFPLALMVVFLHAEPNVIGLDVSELNVENLWANIAGLIMYGISHVIVQIAVPAFFMISGYLFFLSFDNNPSVLKRKLSSRVSSILIPYILWVFIFCVIHIIRHIHTIGNIPAWINEQGGVLSLFWNSQQWISGAGNIFGQQLMMTGPFAFHLWFLRDLIVLLLMTPVFYFCLKGRSNNRCSIIFLGCIALLYLLQLPSPIAGISFRSMFYFGLGAYISLNHLYLSDIFYRYRYSVGIVAVVLVILETFLDGSRTQLGSIIFPIFTFVGVITLLNLAAYYERKEYSKRLFIKYEKSTFFLFIIHPFFLGLVWTSLNILTMKVFHVNNIMSIETVNNQPLLTLALFFLKVLLATVCSLITFKMINMTSPKLSKILCGR